MWNCRDQYYAADINYASVPLSLMRIHIFIYLYYTYIQVNQPKNKGRTPALTDVFRTIKPQTHTQKNGPFEMELIKTLADI